MPSTPPFNATSRRTFRRDLADPAPRSTLDREPASISHGFFGDLDPVDPGAGRATLAKGKGELDSAARTFEEGFYTSVWAIANKTREREALRFVPGGGAKKNALDAPDHSDPTRDRSLCDLADLSPSQPLFQPISIPMTHPRPPHLSHSRSQRTARAAAPLSPRAARVLYNLLDAWFPPDATEHPGAGDFDLVGATLDELDARERRGLGAGLVLLDWSPRLALGAQGYCALPRPERQRWLARLRRWLPSRLQRRLDALQRAAGSAYRDALAGWVQLSSPDP